MSDIYLRIVDRLPIRQRSIIRESDHYKIYLPTEFNDIWQTIKEENRTISAIIFLPEQINYVDKIVIRRRHIVKENNRFKIYLPKRYQDIWSRLEGKKVDLLILFG